MGHSPSQVLPGHGLMYEGSPFDEMGIRLSVGTSGVGAGKCSCGELSPQLTSGRARRAWHVAHKDEVRARIKA